MDDEILVHVSAPTTHKSDGIYRSLAKAYADFESYHREDDRSHNTTTVIDSPAKSIQKRFSEDADTGLAATKESFGSFPSCISLGAHDNVPPFLAPPLESFEDSVVDSSRLAQLERIQLHWKRRTGPKSSFPAASSGIIASAGHPDATFIEDSQLAAQALQSQLFDRGSTTSEDTSSDEEEEPEHDSRSEPALSLPEAPSDRRVPKDQHIAFKAGSSSVSSSNEQAAVIAAGGNANQGQTRTILRSCLVTPSEPLKATPLQENSRATHLSSLDFSQFPTEVFPPAPKVSVSCPSTLPAQTTSYLKRLKQDYVDRFNPAVKSRHLRADERGYWLIDTVNWSQKDQYDFWSVLCEHVRLGDFGWGVSVFRDPPSSGKMEMGSNARIGQVRFYCWGEVAEEVWLALWVCSRGNVAGSGARWLDAGDAIVIQVP